MNSVFECAICFEEYDWGYMADKTICIFCVEKLNSNTLHPVKQTPIQRCICGQIWLVKCRFAAITGDKLHGIPRNTN